MYIQKKKIMWINSPSTDVVLHRVYVVEETETIDPINSTHVDLASPINEYEMPGVFTIVDGKKKVGVAAIDNSGNISNTIEQVFTFDFLEPLAPYNLQLVNG